MHSMHQRSVRLYSSSTVTARGVGVVPEGLQEILESVDDGLVPP